MVRVMKAGMKAVKIPEKSPTVLFESSLPRKKATSAVKAPMKAGKSRDTVITSTLIPIQFSRK